MATPLSDEPKHQINQEKAMETMASHNEGKTSHTSNSLDMSDNLPG